MSHRHDENGIVEQWSPDPVAIGRADRRRAIKAQQKEAKRKAKAKPDLMETSSGQNITLQNPVSQHFGPFIIANAIQWEQMAMAEFDRVAPDDLATLVAEWKDKQLETVDMMGEFLAGLVTHQVNRFVVEQDSAKGQHLVLCGAGPTLNAHIAEWAPKADQLWGCNTGLTYLIAQGYQPTHGFAVDQTAEMLREWSSTPDVEYLVASTVHPHLVELLRGRDRRIRFFHNYVGVQGQDVAHGGETYSYEDWMYAALYPSTIRAGSGLNSVNRAIDVATYMGFDKITVLGADCCLQVNTPNPGAHFASPEHTAWLRDHVVMHADGGSAIASNATPMTLEGTIDGRLWTTKPDMIISAVFLEKTRQQMGGRLELIGDTLPNALRDKPDSYLLKLPTLIATDGSELFPDADYTPASPVQSIKTVANVSNAA